MLVESVTLVAGHNGNITSLLKRNSSNSAH
jgi:hypothetical protein